MLFVFFTLGSLFCKHVLVSRVVLHPGQISNIIWGDAIPRRHQQFMSSENYQTCLFVKQPKCLWEIYWVFTYIHTSFKWLWNFSITACKESQIQLELPLPHSAEHSCQQVKPVSQNLSIPCAPLPRHVLADKSVLSWEQHRWSLFSWRDDYFPALPLQWYYPPIHLEILETFLQGSLLTSLSNRSCLLKKKKKSSKQQF